MDCKGCEYEDARAEGTVGKVAFLDEPAHTCPDRDNEGEQDPYGPNLSTLDELNDFSEEAAYADYCASLEDGEESPDFDTRDREGR